MSTHQHDRSNQHRSNQHSPKEANKTAGSAEDQDHSRGSHTARANQSGKGAEKPQNDMSAQKSSAGHLGEHRHDGPRKEHPDKQASGDASRSAGHDERITGGSRKR
jgi:hypothetical protein